jgi:hypothetical protein
VVAKFEHDKLYTRKAGKIPFNIELLKETIQNGNGIFKDPINSPYDPEKFKKRSWTGFPRAGVVWYDAFDAGKVVFWGLLG